MLVVRHLLRYSLLNCWKSTLSEFYNANLGHSLTLKEAVLNLPGCASGRSGCASVKKVNLKESLVTDKLTESLTSECV